eukprot:135892-Chlamydomonas_euryale.AAC.1
MPAQQARIIEHLPHQRGALAAVVTPPASARLQPATHVHSSFWLSTYWSIRSYLQGSCGDLGAGPGPLRSFRGVEGG